MRLTRSEPASDSTLATAPQAIKLWFSAPIQVNLTTVRVTTGGQPVETAAPKQAEAAVAPIVADLTSRGAPGRYAVSWRTMSRDGHVVSGTFAYTVAAPAPAP